MAKTERDSYLYAFGCNLAEIWRRKGVSQEQLAFAADISLSALSKLERGLINISVYNAYKLSNALNLNISDLFIFDFPTIKKK